MIITKNKKAIYLKLNVVKMQVMKKKLEEYLLLIHLNI